MQDLTVTLVQTDIIWENVSANLHHLDTLFSKNTLGDLVVLPEMFATGFSMNSHDISQSFHGEQSILTSLRGWAYDYQKAFMGSIAVEEDGTYYNRLFVALPDGQLKWYDKRHLFALAGENLHYTAGENRLVFDYLGWKINPLICYDLRFPVFCRNTEAFDLQIFVANWPQKRSFAWKTLLVARAIENQCFVVGVNRVGVDGNGHEYQGDSSAIDPLGQHLVTMLHKETLTTVKLSASVLKNTRTSLNFLADRDIFELR
jgi:predicted amidohydrolase